MAVMSVMDGSARRRVIWPDRAIRLSTLMLTRGFCPASRHGARCEKVLMRHVVVISLAESVLVSLRRRHDDLAGEAVTVKMTSSARANSSRLSAASAIRISMGSSWPRRSAVEQGGR
jgi:hypothetical protein